MTRTSLIKRENLLGDRRGETFGKRTINFIFKKYISSQINSRGTFRDFLTLIAKVWLNCSDFLFFELILFG